MTISGADSRHEWHELNVETFSNARGGNIYYKALTHPLTAEKMGTLLRETAAAGATTMYDPRGRTPDFLALHDLGSLDIQSAFVQRTEDVGRTVDGHLLRPATELSSVSTPTLFIPDFDTGVSVSHIRHLLPTGVRIVTLDDIRLPDDHLSDRLHYLAPVNFATNFAFFRDSEGLHTRLVTADYWSPRAEGTASLWCRLFDVDGKPLATWLEPLPGSGGTVIIDSREVRDRFELDDFTGQLFVHAIGIGGHDIVKYALDVWGDGRGSLSCTHDSNAWPSDRYAGLPAPAADQAVVVWIQNSHPRPIPAGSIGLAEMGSEAFIPLISEIPPYGSCPLDTRTLLPDVVWPSQFEIRAGKHAARPRYEVLAGKKRWLAHVNVARSDLQPDPEIRRSAGLLGKGFILPAPILPRDRWRTMLLPTPMTRAQTELPLAMVLYDPRGVELSRRTFGRVPRGACPLIDVTSLLDEDESLSHVPWGHLELVYDFADGGEGDGWLHGLFRYVDRTSGHTADTSFGSHIFNTVMTLGREPQSYSGPPPGLSTRLFVRLGHPPFDTVLHLIYPASLPWHPVSSTTLSLIDGTGRKVAERQISIPCGGSTHLRYSALFETTERELADPAANIIVRDATCRLFGYHGLVDQHEFCLDHMFGF